MKYDYIDIIGLFGSLILSISFIPQTYHVYKNKDSVSINKTFFGIGAGGYRSVVSTVPAVPDINADNRISTFAWQAGGGLIYDVSDHMALDLGYRFFSIGDSTVNYSTGAPYTTNYAASELLLTVRIYEPFRRWR